MIVWAIKNDNGYWKSYDPVNGKHYTKDILAVLRFGTFCNSFQGAINLIIDIKKRWTRDDLLPVKIKIEEIN